MPRPTDYFSSDSIRQDLKGKTVRGGLYTAISQTACVGIQLASLPILSRLLAPDAAEDFGLVSMATVFTGFAAMFVDAGMSTATIQREKITHAQVSNLFWLTTSLGTLMAVITSLAAPSIGWFYGEPRLVPVVIAVAISYIFAGITSQHMALLTRTMRFKASAIIRVLANLASQLVAIAYAWSYHDYWALAIRPIILASVMMIGTWAACSWRPGWPSRKSYMDGMIGMGANLFGFNILYYFRGNADNLLIGKWWGAGELGYYHQAYKLFLFPVRQINGPLRAIAVPALSRLIDQPERYRKCYTGLVGYLALLTIPAASFLFFAADLVIPVALGKGWEPAIPILRLLALAGFIQAVGSTIGWLYTSQGRTKELMQFGLITTPFILIAFVVGLRWGALGVAAAQAFVTAVVTFPLGTYQACRKGHVRVHDVLGVFPLPLLVSAAVAAGVWISKIAFVGWNIYFTCGMSMLISTLSGATLLLVLPSGRSAILEGWRLINARKSGASPSSQD